MGCGKSVITKTVMMRLIQEISRTDSDEEIAILYYFCCRVNRLSVYNAPRLDTPIHI
jgi:hypothetical protein